MYGHASNALFTTEVKSLASHWPQDPRSKSKSEVLCTSAAQRVPFHRKFVLRRRLGRRGAWRESLRAHGTPGEKGGMRFVIHTYGLGSSLDRRFPERIKVLRKSKSYRKLLPGAPGSNFRQDFDSFSKSARGVPGTTSGGLLLFPGILRFCGDRRP